MTSAQGNEHLIDALASIFQKSERGSNIVITMARERTLRSEADLDEVISSQLRHVLQTCYWGGAKSIQQCFDRKCCDEGIMWVKEMLVGCDTSNDSGRTDEVRLFYWLARFGGNESGYAIIASGADPDDNGGDEMRSTWRLLVENCDSDFIWRGGDQFGVGSTVTKAFVKEFKKAALGDYYEEDEA